MEKPLAYRPHPWHGLASGERCPEVVTAYIEIVPTDGVKYEIDKHSGYLRVDRPQRFSVVCPTLYGFVPQTYCGEAVAAHRIPGGPSVTHGDGDPLDVCVLTDRPVSRGEIVLEARPIGGLRMVEAGEADDKIIAVLLGDPTFGELAEVRQQSRAVVDRLRHYFLTYKTIPGETATISVDPVYDAKEARAVIMAAREDYRRRFGDGVTEAWRDVPAHPGGRIQGQGAVHEVLRGGGLKANTQGQKRQVNRKAPIASSQGSARAPTFHA